MLRTLIMTIPITITFIAIIIKITIIKVTIIKLTIIKIAIIPIIIIIIIIITITTKRHVAPSNISALTSWTSSRALPSQSKTVSHPLRSSPTKGNPAQKPIAGWTKVMTPYKSPQLFSVVRSEAVKPECMVSSYIPFENHVMQVQTNPRIPVVKLIKFQDCQDYLNESFKLYNLY